MENKLIAKYVPKKYHETIQDMEKDSEGYWIYLNDNYISNATDSHTIHEYNLKDLKKQFKTIERIKNK